MEKLKTMWNDLSKKGKIALVAVVIIAVIVLYNAVL
jgi:flagellar biosynthesis/type III secretory pathway M-ring protein FliF/YscJ|tara:strand:- start:45 stop:152 length:108 start_codon:yes stop_codon:yes gene_type:complete